MSNPCSDPVSCPGGNCIGCKNGNIWCQDPRCAPYCQGCAIPDDHDFNGNMVVTVILICLVALLFIVWFIYGPSLFEPHNDHERANVLVPEEMKNK